MKRLMDVLGAFIGLLIASPLLLPVLLLVWRQDYKSPFYIALRVGKNGRLFRMVKLRSMVSNADKSGVDSTSENDPRITPIGHFIRRWKLDELTQLWNVLLGDMTLVGPRPNVQRETDLYTSVEKGLLNVPPGITDFSSIVFSDEAEILKDSKNPDIDYNQLIRPWKSRLGLLYVKYSNLLLDICLIILTILAILSRGKALFVTVNLLKWLNAPEDVIRIASRDKPLLPYPPPGSAHVVTSRKDAQL